MRQTKVRLTAIRISLDAIEAYSKAIELDKDYIAAVYNRGNAFLKLGKEDLAYKDLCDCHLKILFFLCRMRQTKVRLTAIRISLDSI
jgi:hypothetical protein